MRHVMDMKATIDHIIDDAIGNDLISQLGEVCVKFEKVPYTMIMLLKNTDSENIKMSTRKIKDKDF